MITDAPALCAYADCPCPRLPHDVFCRLHVYLLSVAFDALVRRACRRAEAGLMVDRAFGEEERP